MLVKRNSFKVIRFEINSEYSKKIVPLSENVKLRYEVGKNTQTGQVILNLRWVVNLMDKASPKIEVVGFLGEIKSEIKRTTKDHDKFMLKEFIQSSWISSEIYLQEAIPTSGSKFQLVARPDIVKYTEEVYKYIVGTGLF